MSRTMILLLAIAGLLSLSALMSALDYGADAGASNLPGPVNDFFRPGGDDLDDVCCSSRCAAPVAPA